MDGKSRVDNDSVPIGVEIIETGPMQDGQFCPCCQSVIAQSSQVGRCPKCGHLQHVSCWSTAQRCCSYVCELSTARPTSDLMPQIVVSPEDVESVVEATPAISGGRASLVLDPTSKRWSRLAVASFAFALLGTVMLGIPGIVAVVLGVVALGPTAFKHRLRGGPLAVAGIIIGVVDVVGWSLAVTMLIGDRLNLQPAHQGFRPIGTSLHTEELALTPAPIQRAIRANVLVVTRQARGTWEGSGVVLERRDYGVFVVTNRHVIEGDDGNEPVEIDITFFDGSRQEAQLVWTGEGGVDLAVLSCESTGDETEVALIARNVPLAVGQPVFAIGNPFGLGWSYSTGAISAVREQTWSGTSLRVIQTQTPLNPGNSGGGLYDKEGRLVGINTLNTDKNRTEGIGFAIAFEDMVPLLEHKAGLVLDQGTRERP